MSCGKGDLLRFKLNKPSMGTTCLCLDFVEAENGNGFAVADTGCALNGSTFVLPDGLIDARQTIIVEAGKVQLSEVSSVVHVANEDVHILSGADT